MTSHDRLSRNKNLTKMRMATLKETSCIENIEVHRTSFSSNSSVTHSVSRRPNTKAVKAGCKGKCKKKSRKLSSQSSTADAAVALVAQESLKNDKEVEKQTYPCSFCDFVCQSSSDFALHQKILHREEHMFSCSLCHYVCEKPSLLTLHMLVHNGDMKITCVLCNMKFSHMYYLRKHLRNHIVQQKQRLPRRLRCPFCQKIFCWKINYNKHIITHTSFKVHKCFWCDFSTNQITELVDHRYTHGNENGCLTCLECQSVFPSVTDHDIHMLLHHVKSYSKMTRSEHVSACTLCGKIFHKFSDLKLHMISTHAKECSLAAKDEKFHLAKGVAPDKQYLCSVCGNFLRTPNALKTHRCKSAEEKLFMCSTCKRKFQNRSQLKSHEFVHTGQKPFLCSSCPYSCRRMQYLKRHILTHSGEKTHLCTICGQSFVLPEALKRHMYKHAHERPFSCTQCSYSTSDPSGLTQHMTKHINNFLSCDYCGFSCIRISDMEKHKSSHVIDKLIPCSSCSLTFANSKELQSHMLGHVNQKLPNYSCNVCTFKCQVQKAYLAHMQTHSIDKPFACTECGYCSNRRMNLKVHMIKKHKLSLTGVVTFKCKTCQFECERDQDYIRHMMVNHNIDKPFDCPVCPFATHRQVLLKVHLEIHKPHGFFCHLCSFKCKRKTLLNKHLAVKHLTGNGDENTRPVLERKFYNCKLCDFTSKHYASLRNHMPVHSGVKLACEECNYVTYAKRNLASHMKSHISEKPFKCVFCSYSSARKNNFKLHMVRHMNEKIYLCDVCDFSAKYEVDLTEHVALSHRDSVAHTDTPENVVTLYQNPCQGATNKKQLTSEYVLIKGRTEDFDYKENNVLMEGTKHCQEFENHICTYNSQTCHLESDSMDNNNMLGEMCTPFVTIEYASNNVHSSCYTQADNDSAEQSSGMSSAFTPVKESDAEGHQKQYINLTAYNPADYVEKDSHNQILQQAVSVNFSSSSFPANAVQQYSTAPQNSCSSGPPQVLVDSRECEVLNKDITNCPQSSRSVLHPNHSQFEIFHPYQNMSVLFSNSSARTLIQVPHSDNSDCSPSSAYKVNKGLQDDYSTKETSFSQHMTHLWVGKAFSCSSCSFHCSCEEDFKQHVLIHSLIPNQTAVKYVCSACQVSFNSVEDLDRHNLHCSLEQAAHEDHHDQAKVLDAQAPVQKSTYVASQTRGKHYRCIRCNYTSDRPSSFKRHMLSAHGIEKAFSCTLCSYSTKREDDLKTHSITHDDRMIRSCSVCDYTCKREPAMRKHMWKHTDVQLFSCQLCNFWCNYEPDLRSHVFKTHEKPKNFTCDLCSYSTGFAIHFKEHMLVNHAVENAFKCPHCDYSTSLWNNFRAHKLKHTRTKKYACSLCGLAFKRSTGLKNHMYKHSSTKSLTCSRCDYQCNLPEKLKIHMRRHTNNYLYKCRICQRSYTHSSSLSKHISQVHKKLKRHACSECSYTACTSSQLRRHTRTHGMANLFKCKVCHFGCSHLEILKNHMLLHNLIATCGLSSNTKVITSELTEGKSIVASTTVNGTFASSSEIMIRNKPPGFTCSTCMHTFSTLSNFKKHVLRHKRTKLVRRFLCSICDFSCLRSHELKMHTSFHTGEKLFSCNMCDFACNRPYTLKYHKQKKHRSEQVNNNCNNARFLKCQMCEFTSSKRLYLKYHVQEKHRNSGSVLTCSKNSEKITAVGENSSSDLTSSEKSKKFTVGSDNSALVLRSSENSVVYRMGSENPTSFSTASEKCLNFTMNSQNVKLQSATDTRTCTRLMKFQQNQNKQCSQNTKATEKTFMCSECNYSSTSKGNLSTHILKHAKKSFLCHLCDYMCRRQRELKRHLITHADRKPLSCNQCPYTCIQSASLKVHMLKHKGEKPVCCKLCNFRCRQKSTLRDHMTTHSDERRFACSQCDYRAKRAVSLKMHLLTHTSERPVCCTLCDFTCKHMNALRSHMRSHTTDKLSD